MTGMCTSDKVERWVHVTGKLSAVARASYISKQRPQYTGDILKRSFISTAYTLIRQKNGAFRNRSLNRRNLKTLVFRFRVEKTEVPENDGESRFISLTEIQNDR